MFPVEVRIRDEALLATEMGAIRTRLDHKKFVPTRFLHTFDSPGVVVRVHFSTEAEAVAFGAAFRGQILPPPAADAI